MASRRRVTRPYIMGLIPYPFNQGVVVQGILDVSSQSAEGPDGILLPSRANDGGRFIDIAVNSPPELYTHALWLRFGVHNPDADPAAGEGSRGINLRHPLPCLPEFTAAANGVVPWSTFVEIQVYYMIRATRDVMGGQALTANASKMDIVPVQASSIEQSMDGMGQVRLKGLVPPRGQILVKARNTHPTADLRIGGYVMSYAFHERAVA